MSYRYMAVFPNYILRANAYCGEAGRRQWSLKLTFLWNIRVFKFLWAG